MTPQVLLSLVLLLPVLFWAGSVCRGRRGILVGYLGAWMFLPAVGFKVSFFGIIDKGGIAAAATLAVVTILDWPRVSRLRLSWMDIPMLVWCLCPFASSISNGLGPYDGLTAVAGHTTEWGIPYLLGRIYFADLKGARDLAIGVFVAGLIYTVPCLFEMRMSPLLAKWVYGRQDIPWMDAHRLGGWRPLVFMQHGLALGMWMACTAVVGTWLWLCGSVKRIGQYRVSWLAPYLAVVSLLCRSTGAIVLQLVATLVLLLSRKVGWRLWWALVVIAAPVYVASRATGVWSGDQLLDVTTSYVGADRAQSLNTRLVNEDKLAAKAELHPIFGWGRWGRALIYNDAGHNTSTTDGLWIIAFGECGTVGLLALLLWQVLPAALLLRTQPKLWLSPSVAPVAALALVGVLIGIDNLMNAMPDPVLTTCVGAAVGVLQGTRQLSMLNVSSSAGAERVAVRLRQARFGAPRHIASYQERIV